MLQRLGYRPDQGLESVQSAGVGVLPRGQARFLLKYTLQVGGTDADGLAQLGKGRQAIGVFVEVRVDLMADMFNEIAIATLLVWLVWEAAQAGPVTRRLGLFGICKESNVGAIGSAAGADGAAVNAGGTYGIYKGAVVCRVSLEGGVPQRGRGWPSLRVSELSSSASPELTRRLNEDGCRFYPVRVIELDGAVEEAMVRVGPVGLAARWAQTGRSPPFRRTPCPINRSHPCCPSPLLLPPSRSRV